MMRRALLFLVPILVALEALARVGGGDSYSGGGSSDGGDGGDAELVYYVVRFLIWLTFEHPAIGIPIDIAVIGLFVMYKRRGGGKKAVTVLSVSTAPPRSAAKLDALRRFDPNFSEIVFTDFCYSLYARAHHARGAGDLHRYALYLSEEARRALLARNRPGLQAVRGVIVGSFRILGVRGLDSPYVSVDVEYESNMTEVVNGIEMSWYVQEQWVLERKRDILSPPPDKAKADHCPRCGAALQTRTDGACDYCGVRISNGTFHWFVRAIPRFDQDSRGPLLTSNVPERGTDLPTRYSGRRPELPPSFEERVREIAVELQEAWTAREWERVRPLETENLFQMHRYWIDAYKRQGLRNVVDDFEITRIEPVKITSDAFYEAVTVRLFARGRDYTVNEQGSVVGGSKEQTRVWSEYWTLIRTHAGGKRMAACPNCGASVDAGATAICDYCGGKMTAGAFDWALSRIEQDESYG